MITIETLMWANTFIFCCAVVWSETFSRYCPAESGEHGHLRTLHLPGAWCSLHMPQALLKCWCLLALCGTTDRQGDSWSYCLSFSWHRAPLFLSPRHVLFLIPYLRSFQTSWESILFFLCFRFWKSTTLLELVVFNVRESIL